LPALSRRESADHRIWSFIDPITVKGWQMIHSSARPGFRAKLSRSSLTLGLVGMVLIGVSPGGAQASTDQFHGVNWADSRDNFVNGVLYVSGLTSSDTYASASTVADAVVGQLYSTTGANTVRMPVNEPTVSSYWNTYTGAIDTALGKGKVIIAYWASSGGKPQNSGTFNAMWDKIVDRYGSNPQAYFEVINEPYGLSTPDLNNLYSSWLNRFPSVPRERVILDGAGLATNVPAVGNDTRLNGTLLAAHDYTMFMTPPLDSENQWARHFSSSVGNFASRTIATEWGAPMGPGSKYNIQWDKVNYNIPSGSWWADYIRGISSELRTSGMGSVFWPGLRDGDWYSLTSRSGSGANTTLSVVNPSGVARLQYAWGLTDTGSTTVGVRSTSSGQYADGLGGTANGSAVGLGGDSSTATRQWQVENDGDYVRFKNTSTGLYLDGMGRAAGGALGQYAYSTSGNQQWSVLTDANNVRIKNRGTGLFLQATGTSLAQYADSGNLAQRWKIVATGS
jgi:ricin-type beta-trefoil lectin protein/cellulase (glycosyl hydrolase family 5)